MRQPLRQSSPRVVGRQLRVAIKYLIDAGNRVAGSGTYLLTYAAGIMKRGKADKHQGAEGNAFVIALDVSELPAAHTQIRNELPIYFDAWPKVSGVLLFDYIPWVGYREKNGRSHSTPTPRQVYRLQKNWIFGRMDVHSRSR